MENFVSADDAVAAEILNRVGIKLIPVNIRPDDYEQIARLDASGTLPDLLRMYIASPFFINLVNEGKLKAWTAEYAALEQIMNGSEALAAVTHLYGAPWFMPITGEPNADPGRIYYRKDWLAELGLPQPATSKEFSAMLEAFYNNKKRPGLTLAGGVTYLTAMFGADPYSWINENSEWIPAYYSQQMIAGLEYTRTLYENNWLDFEYSVTRANAAVNKFTSGGAGSLIRHGDTLWMRRVLSAFAENYGISVQEAFDGYIGVLPPLITSATTWPRVLPSAGIVMPSDLSDETVSAAQALLNFVLTEDARNLARFGIPGETSALSADGSTRLLIDPATAEPFDIIARYPSAQVLYLMSAPFSPPLPSKVSASLEATDTKYEAAVPKLDDGWLAHFIYTPSRVRFESEVNVGAAFNAIVMGDAPVAEMFASFRALCEEKGIRQMIDEVNNEIQ
jgi:putative aldouronate transport system substrate-binding protein